MAPLDVSLESVGAIIRTRTKESNGVERGTFTSETRPTNDEVVELIQQVIADTLGSHATDIADKCADSAARLVALRTAALIELSYFPEQVATGRSPYAQLNELAGAMEGRVFQCLGIVDPGSTAGGGDVFIGMPKDYGWSGPLLGETTRW